MHAMNNATTVPDPYPRDKHGRFGAGNPGGGRRSNAGSTVKEWMNGLQDAPASELSQIAESEDEPSTRCAAARLWLILRQGPVDGERGSRREYLDALRTLIDYTDGKPVERHEIRSEQLDPRARLEQIDRMLADAGYPNKQIESRVVGENNGQG